MTSYYTGKGDKGETDTMGFGRISKDTKLADLLGDIDELNSMIGVSIANTSDEHVSNIMRTLQDRLFIAGSDVASSESHRSAKRIKESDVKWVEEQVDEIGAKLPELKKFVLPGGSVSSAYLHLARSVARRAERTAVSLSKKQKLNEQLLAFLNRASSLLFVCALYMNKKEGVEETNPTY